ncbi:MAG: YceI family protein [Acidimicrobiales bacterium]
MRRATTTFVPRTSYKIDEFPTITFKSTGVEVLGDDRYKLNGDLTIEGTTHPVSLEVQKYGEFNDDTMGHRIAYINRMSWLRASPRAAGAGVGESNTRHDRVRATRPLLRPA